MCVIKHWTSSTTFVIDLGMIIFTSNTAVSFAYVAKNSQVYTVNSVSVSGSTVTLTFNIKVYANISVIKVI